MCPFVKRCMIKNITYLKRMEAARWTSPVIAISSHSCGLAMHKYLMVKTITRFKPNWKQKMLLGAELGI